MSPDINYLHQVRTVYPRRRPLPGSTLDKEAVNAYWREQKINPNRRERKGPAMAREATIGPIVYERVTQLTGGANPMKKSEAFRQVAVEQLDASASEEEIVKKARSVATTFYRLQRLEQAGEGATPKAAAAAAPAASEDAPAPKKRGRPKGSKNAPKAEATATAPAVIVVAGQNGYDPDLLSALGQAQEAVKKAVEQAREQQAEIRSLREFKEKAQAVLGSLG